MTLSNQKKAYETRNIAIDIIKECLLHKIRLEVCFQKHTQFLKLSQIDRNFCFLIVKDTLRYYGQTQYILSHYLKTKTLPKKKKEVQLILCAAITQNIFLDQPAHAVIDGAVEITKKRGFKGLAGFVNAILRNIISDKQKILDNKKYEKATFPQWFDDYIKSKMKPSEYEAMREAALSQSQIDIVVKEKPDLWAEKLGCTYLYGNVLRLVKKELPIEEKEGFLDGEWWVQGASAASIVGLFSENIERKIIYDLCAAPGGKTIQLCLKNARVTAFDISAYRISKLVENLERMQVSAKIIYGESQNIRLPQSADAILLDAPCSGTGIFQRCPDILWIKDKDTISEGIIIQDQLLDNAADMLKVGGTLIYSVCSLLDCEGEERIKSFLNKNKNFCRKVLKPQDIKAFSHCINKDGDLRIYPFSKPEWGFVEGFFAARLYRMS